MAPATKRQPCGQLLQAANGSTVRCAPFRGEAPRRVPVRDAWWCKRRGFNMPPARVRGGRDWVLGSTGKGDFREDLARRSPCILCVCVCVRRGKPRRTVLVLLGCKSAGRGRGGGGRGNGPARPLARQAGGRTAAQGDGWSRPGWSRPGWQWPTVGVATKQRHICNGPALPRSGSGRSPPAPLGWRVQHTGCLQGSVARAAERAHARAADRGRGVRRCVVVT